jgi:hypothetical protein
MKRQKLDGRQETLLGFAIDASERGRHFFYVRIPESLGPLARGVKYEDPLRHAIGNEGEVTGGGSQLGDGDAIEFCGIDVEVNDRTRGLEIIRKVMRASGAPAQTIIEEYVPKYQKLPLQD